MIRFLKFFGWMWIFCLSLSAWGQTPGPTPTPVENVAQMSEGVVYGEQPAGEVVKGPALDSIKTDSRLADLLDQNAGLETEGLGIAKSFANVSIRGSGTNQVLVLLNGQRTNQGFDL